MLEVFSFIYPNNFSYKHYFVISCPQFLFELKMFNLRLNEWKRLFNNIHDKPNLIFFETILAANTK